MISKRLVFCFMHYDTISFSLLKVAPGTMQSAFKSGEKSDKQTDFNRHARHHKIQKIHSPLRIINISHRGEGLITSVFHFCKTFQWSLLRRTGLANVARVTIVPLPPFSPLCVFLFELCSQREPLDFLLWFAEFVSIVPPTVLKSYSRDFRLLRS